MDELRERGWTQADLALILNRHVPAVNDIVHGKRPVTPEIAVELGIAFDIHPSVWLEREATYRLSLINGSDEEMRRRTRLFQLAPVKEMEKRGWIKSSQTTDELERQLLSFFEIESAESEPQIHAVTKQTFRGYDLTGAQRAWVFRAAQLARILNVARFSQKQFEEGLLKIRALAPSAEKVCHVPRLLAELGVRLVIVEPLPRSRIDGAAFWIGDEPSPVIVLSLRYDRIDAFWHTLAHEIVHIKHGDSRSLDSDLVGESRIKMNDAMEERAEYEAADFLIPREKLESFAARHRPFYSKTKIIQFSQRMHVHPGIVTGQLQHEKEVPWKSNREMLVKIRNLVTTTAITDGWGKTVITK
jgi:HTH-type transcriptional regulator/antitoxin HigA